MGDERYRVESFDLWHYFSRALFEPLIRLRVDLAGCLDADALARAVEASCVTLPLVGCGFVGGDRRPRWVPRPGAEREVVRVVEGGDDPEARVRAALLTSPDVERGPQLVLTLVRTPDRDTLCLVVNHMLCDATGLTEYVRGLSQLYADVAEGGRPEPSPWRPRGVRAALSGIGWRERSRILRTRFEAYDQGAIGGASRPQFRHGPGPARLLTRSLAPDVFAAARAASRARGSSVNDVFLVALGRAWADATSTPRVTLPGTIDGRQFLAVGSRIGPTNLSSTCLVTVDGQTELADALARVTAQMAVHKHGTSALKSLLVWDLAVAALPYRYLASHFTRLLSFPALTFTNLGVLREETVAFGSVPVERAYLSTAVKPSPFFQLSVSTFRGAPTLSATITGDDDAAAFAAGVLDATARIVADLPAWGCVGRR